MPYQLQKGKKPKHADEGDLVQVNCQLTKLMNWRLNQVALSRGISKSQLLREIVDEHLKQEDFRSGRRSREWEK